MNNQDYSSCYLLRATRRFAFTTLIFFNMWMLTAFSASKMGTAVYKVDSFLDVPFDGLDTDGCKHTTCPLESGKLHQFSYLYTIDKLPSVSRSDYNSVSGTRGATWRFIHDVQLLSCTTAHFCTDPKLFLEAALSLIEFAEPTLFYKGFCVKLHAPVWNIFFLISCPIFIFLVLS